MLTIKGTPAHCPASCWLIYLTMFRSKETFIRYNGSVKTLCIYPLIHWLPQFSSIQSEDCWGWWLPENTQCIISSAKSSKVTMNHNKYSIYTQPATQNVSQKHHVKITQSADFFWSLGREAGALQSLWLQRPWTYIHDHEAVTSWCNPNMHSSPWVHR